MITAHGNPKELGFSKEKLAEIRIEMEGAIEKNKFVGGIGLVECKGKIAYSESFGVADTESKNPITTDTLFRIYSMTKLITSVAAMMLHDEGKFSLDDPLSKHLPEFDGVRVGVEENGSLAMVDPKRTLTVRQLMTHTAGLTYGSGPTLVDKIYLAENAMSLDDTLEAATKKLGKLPLQNHPGDVWHYSWSADVVGRLVEALSGLAFDRFLEERLFQPLGMANTFFAVPSEKFSRMAGNYVLGENKKVRPIEAKDKRQDFTVTPKNFSGGGGLVSTMHDYFKFLKMVLNKGSLDKNQILKPETVALMFENHAGGAKIGMSGLTMGVTQEDGFGLGFSRIKAPGNSKSMTHGWGGWAGTSAWVDPANDLLGLWMVQVYEGMSGYRFKVKTYEALDG